MKPALVVRAPLVLLHRWFGLGVALFLFVSGLTGAVISWDHELDAWLNPQLFHAGSSGTLPARPGLELARQLEAQEPRLLVNYMLTSLEPGHTALMSVEPRIDAATGKPYELGYNQVALDPVSGQVQGTRQWGAVSLTRENLLPFLYKLHYSMHIPDSWGKPLGMWFMGLVGIVWLFDCFIALYLSFPNWRSWRKSLAFRWQHRGSAGHKLIFDLHRSGGVWVWLLLLVLAVTSVSMNLQTEIVRPLVARLSTLSPNAFDSRTPQPPGHPVEPLLTREQTVALARIEAARRGWQQPAGGVFYSSSYGLYGVGFFEADNDHGDGGLGNNWLYFDARSGQPAGGVFPGTGSAGDIFLQAQFPLHSGRIAGLPGRVLISFMGLVVAMLSVTGLLIWLRKRRARRGQRAGVLAAAGTRQSAVHG